MDLDHRSVRFRHAEHEQRLVEQLLGERLRAVSGDIDADFLEREDRVFRHAFTAARGHVPALRPSRSTVMRSATVKISSSRCEM